MNEVNTPENHRLQQVRAAAGIWRVTPPPTARGGGRGGPAKENRVGGAKVLDGHGDEECGLTATSEGISCRVIAATIIEHALCTLYLANSFTHIHLISSSQQSREVGPITSPQFIGENTEAQEGKVTCP